MPSAVTGLAVSPDGATIAAVEGNPTAPKPSGSLTRWRRGQLAGEPLRVATTVQAVAFSRDGTRMAIGLGDGRALSLDARTGRVLHAVHAADAPITSVAFAPDGTLATGAFRGIVQRWNAAGDRLGDPLLAAAGQVGSIAFSRDGTLFATTGGNDGAVKLWSARDQQQLGVALPGSPDRWGNAVFAPNGRTIVAVYDDGRGTVWPTTIEAWEQRACAVAGRTLTRTEWTRYVPGRAYTHVC
jgi:WD40 repeat protein